MEGAHVGGDGGQRVAAVLCTGNPHKVEELQALLPHLDLHGLAAGDELPPETGTTFADNARIKARGGAALHPGAWALADDSGLCVDALGGEPGVYSARFAGRDGDDEANNRLLLERLAAHPTAADRRARFVCVLVAISPQGDELVAEGTVEGTIAHEPSGSFGFGYDPLFVPLGHERTFGELGADVKHAMSHRARAAARMATLVDEHVAAGAGGPGAADDDDEQAGDGRDEG